MVHSRCRTGASFSARAYSRAIIDQSNTALCATSTRSASRDENSSAISGKSGAPSSTSLVSPWIHTGPGSRSGFTTVYQWSSTSPRASSLYTAAEIIRSSRDSPVVSTSTTAYPCGYAAGQGACDAAVVWSSSMVHEDTGRD
jgi:hypothetical protein